MTHATYRLYPMQVSNILACVSRLKAVYSLGLSKKVLFLGLTLRQ
jgi:hypothetical protein